MLSVFRRIKNGVWVTLTPRYGLQGGLRDEGEEMPKQTGPTPTFGLSLTRSPLSYPVPPPAVISSSSMWGDCHLASAETETPLRGSPLRGQAVGQRWAEVRRLSAGEPPHLVKPLVKTYRQF